MYSNIANSCHSTNGNNGDSNVEHMENGAVEIGGPVKPKELSHEDLYELHHYMQTDLLLDKFQILYAQKFKEMMEQSNNQQDRRSNKMCGNFNRDDDEIIGEIAISAKASPKARGWVLIKVLWGVSNPGYIYAGYAQLVTVSVQCFYPLAVKYLLGLLEKIPTNPFSTRVLDLSLSSFYLPLLTELHKNV